MTGLLNISAEDAEEYSESLAQIGEGWWRQISLAFRMGMPEALGLSHEEWKTKYFGHIRVSRDQLPSAAKELQDEGLDQRESADVLGVNQSTVSRALRDDDANASDDSAGSEEPQVDEPEQLPIDANASQCDDECDRCGAEYNGGSHCPSCGGWLDLPEPESDTPDSEDALPSPPIVEPDPDPEPEPLKPAEPGWHQLGDHLLYCGDSNDPEFALACKGTFAFADPPYNAGKASWDEGFEWTHDYLAEAADIVAVTPGIAALKGFHAVTGMPYQWSIAAEVTNGMTRGALGFGNWIYVALFSTGSLYRNAKDCLRIPAHTSDDKGGEHAARKPLRLLTELIGLFTSKGDTVVDPFLGSGTTLIAAEKTGRRCIGAEIDPMHCAEIIARYNAAVTS